MLIRNFCDIVLVKSSALWGYNGVLTHGVKMSRCNKNLFPISKLNIINHVGHFTPCTGSFYLNMKNFPHVLKFGIRQC